MSLNRLTEGTGRRRTLLQDEDHSGNNPRLIPGIPSLCSEMLPDRFRIVSVLVRSRKIHLV